MELVVFQLFSIPRVLESVAGLSCADGVEVHEAEDAKPTTDDEVQPLSQTSDQLMHDAGMGHEGQVVLNDILCFAKNKYDNYPAAVIKSKILEFYYDDTILDAKQALVQSFFQLIAIISYTTIC